MVVEFRSRIDRSKTFKKGIDCEQNRRNRLETTIQIRKNKKDESLQKRRNINAVSDPVVTSNIVHTEGEKSFNSANSRTWNSTDIPNLSQIIMNSSSVTKDELHYAVVGIRKMLSVERNPPVKDIIDAQILPKLVEILQHDDERIVFDASWALTNVASTEFTRSVVECGAISHLVKLLMHENCDVREQTAWCLGNIAGDAVDLRDMVLGAGGMEPMIINIINPANNSLLSNVVWSLSNLCRGKPQPPLECMLPAISVLGQLIISKNAAAMMDACWALSYLSDGDDSRIQAVIDSGITSTLVELLESKDAGTITPVLRILGNFVSGNAAQTQMVIDANIFNRCADLLAHPKKNIRKETCWLLSNIAAGNQNQIYTLMSKQKIMVKIVDLVKSAEWEVRKEATWVLSNVATGGCRDHIHSLVALGALDALSVALDYSDTKMILVILDAFECILRVGKDSHRDYVGILDECDGIEKIEHLQHHLNEFVYEKAISLIEEFFGVDDEIEDENLAPCITGDMFTFGVKNHEFADGYKSDTIKGFDFSSGFDM